MTEIVCLLAAGSCLCVNMAVLTVLTVLVLFTARTRREQDSLNQPEPLSAAEQEKQRRALEEQARLLEGLENVMNYTGAPVKKERRV